MACLKVFNTAGLYSTGCSDPMYYDGAPPIITRLFIYVPGMAILSKDPFVGPPSYKCATKLSTWQNPCMMHEKADDAFVMSGSCPERGRRYRYPAFDTCTELSR